MNFGLSFEQEMIVDTIRAFVEKEIYPHEAEVERTGEVPLELGHEIRDKCEGREPTKNTHPRDDSNQ